jgi:hypothetical protein
MKKNIILGKLDSVSGKNLSQNDLLKINGGLLRADAGGGFTLSGMTTIESGTFKGNSDSSDFDKA